MKNWKTNLGGAVSVLGTTLIGVGVLGMTNPKYADVLWWIALVGFIISALGKSITSLFAADASAVKSVAVEVDRINALGSDPGAKPLTQTPPEPAAQPKKE